MESGDKDIVEELRNIDSSIERIGKEIRQAKLEILAALKTIAEELSELNGNIRSGM
jgi:hypothetical protein